MTESRESVMAETKLERLREYAAWGGSDSVYAAALAVVEAAQEVDTLTVGALGKLRAALAALTQPENKA
jgi:hypothetical protein